MRFVKLICIIFVMMLGSVTAFAQFTTGNNRGMGRLDAGDYELRSGYKGFVDFGYGIGVGDFGEGRIELQTTHGYQFNPYLFAGIGAGVSYYHEGDVFSVPIYADFRGSLPIAESRVAPFLDMKIGYSVTDVSGLYFSPSIGTRIAIGSRSGVNISLGYELQKYNIDDWYYDESVTIGAFTIKLGFDF